MLRQQIKIHFATTFFDVFRHCKNSAINLIPLLTNNSLLYNGYPVFPEGEERPGRDADRSHPPSAVVKKQ